MSHSFLSFFFFVLMIITFNIFTRLYIDEQFVDWINFNFLFLFSKMNKSNQMCIYCLLNDNVWYIDTWQTVMNIDAYIMIIDWISLYLLFKKIFAETTNSWLRMNFFLSFKTRMKHFYLFAKCAVFFVFFLLQQNLSHTQQKKTNKKIQM